MTLGTTAYLE
jgi:hypothetical protein